MMRARTSCSTSATGLTSRSFPLFYRSDMRLREFLRADFVVSRLQANDMEGVVQEI